MYCCSQRRSIISAALLSLFSIRMANCLQWIKRKLECRLRLSEGSVDVICSCRGCVYIPFDSITKGHVPMRMGFRHNWIFVIHLSCPSRNRMCEWARTGKFSQASLSEGKWGHSELSAVNLCVVNERRN